MKTVRLFLVVAVAALAVATFAADVTVFAASISDGAARTPEAGETVVFSGAA